VNTHHRDGHENSLLVRMYRRWLRWYPQRYRVVYGIGMERMFIDRLAEVRNESGCVGVAFLLIREAWGVTVTALSQRAERWSPRKSTGRTSTQASNHGADWPNAPRGMAWRSIGQDARHALRALIKNPGYALIAVFTLAIGIGANAAIFSVVNGVLLTPLPFQNPEQLVRIWETDPDGYGMGFSPPNFESFSSEVTLMEEMVAYGPTSLTLTGLGDPERLSAMQISAGFFRFLGVPMGLGREFLPDEDGFVADPGAQQVVILDHGMWQQRFAGDRDIIGQTVVLDGVSRTIVGVAPRDLPFGSDDTDIWITWPFDERDLTLRGRHWLRALGRLRPEATLEAAATEFDAIAASLSEAYPESNAGWGILVLPLMDEMVGGVRTQLWILLGAVGFVLLIACSNVANLCLARAEVRGREMAVRSALGAGRGRISSLLLSESMLLAVAGGMVGLGLAWVGVRAVLGGVGSGVPRASEVGVDGTVLGFTTLVVLICGVAVGLIAALQHMRRDHSSALREGGQQVLDSGGRRHVSGILVVTEVALSLMLVIGAALLIKSFWLLIHVDAGFDRQRLLIATISLPESSYQSDAQRATLFGDLVREIGQRPGVANVAATTGLPIIGGRLTVISLPERPEEMLHPIARRRVTSDYFRTMGIPMLEGRSFNVGDQPDAPHVVIVKETLAKRCFPSESAIGKSILWGGPDGTEPFEIIGVVGDNKQYGLADEVLPAMYLEYAQIYVSEYMHLTVRAEGDPYALLPAIRETLRTLDPSLPIYEVTTMDQVLSDSVGSERFSVLLLGAFAMIALLLGSIGIYGVMSYTVSQRTQEVGVRMALGAAHKRVVSMVVRQGMVLALIGIALGTLGALGLSRVLSGMLYQVSSTDLTTFLSVILLLTTVAAIACYVPARRAANIDPLDALRYE